MTRQALTARAPRAQACGTNARQVEAWKLRRGDAVIDPDGTLALHEETVRVTGRVVPDFEKYVSLTGPDHKIAIAYTVPGTSISGVFTALESDLVWVVRGARR